MRGYPLELKDTTAMNRDKEELANQGREAIGAAPPLHRRALKRLVVDQKRDAAITPEMA
jgi:hypothetical protein